MPLSLSQPQLQATTVTANKASQQRQRSRRSRVPLALALPNHQRERSRRPSSTKHLTSEPQEKTTSQDTTWQHLKRQPLEVVRLLNLQHHRLRRAYLLVYST